MAQPPSCKSARSLCPRSAAIFFTLQSSVSPSHALAPGSKSAPPSRSISTPSCMSSPPPPATLPSELTLPSPRTYNLPTCDVHLCPFSQPRCCSPPPATTPSSHLRAHHPLPLALQSPKTPPSNSPRHPRINPPRAKTKEESPRL